MQCTSYYLVSLTSVVNNNLHVGEVFYQMFSQMAFRLNVEVFLRLLLIV